MVKSFPVTLIWKFVVCPLKAVGRCPVAKGKEKEGKSTMPFMMRSLETWRGCTMVPGPMNATVPAVSRRSTRSNIAWISPRSTSPMRWSLMAKGVSCINKRWKMSGEPWRMPTSLFMNKLSSRNNSLTPMASCIVSTVSCFGLFVIFPCVFGCKDNKKMPFCTILSPFSYKKDIMC